MEISTGFKEIKEERWCLMKPKMNKKTIRDLADKQVPDMKDSIKQTPTYHRFMTAAQNTSSFKLPFKRLAFATSFAMLILFSLIAIPFMTPSETLTSTSSLYFEINPSFELIIDDKEKIVELNGQNEDGNFVATNNQQIINRSFDDGFDLLIDYMIDENFIDDEASFILYDVINENEEIASKHLSLIEDRLKHIQESKVPHMESARGIGGQPTDTEHEIANDFDLSIMQVRLIGNILQANDAYDFETLAEKSIQELLAIDDAFPPRNNNDQGPRRHPFDSDDDNGAPPMNPPGRGH